MVNWIKTICVVFLLFVLAGCGFEFMGSGTLPGGSKKICVNVFDNKTTYSGFGNIMSNMMVAEISRFGTAQLANPASADAILKGKITSIQSGSIAHSTLQTPTERRVWVTVEATLVSRGGEILWESGPVTDNEAYFVGGDYATSSRNENKAVEEVMKRIAETMYYRMTSDF